MFVGDPAYAETSPNTVSLPQIGSNSQNIALLQANVSSVSILDDKKSNTNANASDNNIVSGNSLLPATGPLGTSDGKNTDNLSPEDTSVYVVRKGDTVAGIAKLFDVSASTILSANDLKKGAKLTEGDVLLILPVSGTEHTVKKGQTLKGLASLYKVDISDIAQFNGLDEDSKLAIGDKIMIPGGEMLDEGGDKPAANLGSAVAKDKNYYDIHPIQNLLGYFIDPVPTGHKTQGLHGPGHRGIDIGAPTGTPIYASASGVVLAVKTGCVVGRKSCGGGYGNMAIVQHPNGTKTLYGHMYKLNTSTGAEVTQGQLIGFVGSTGRSTGPHVHFEVFGAKNPGSDWSWAN
ncbi:MAG: peptidoglycan DD-metalloendopeptidase family protein [Candidatus Paceibacterota bacterium]|jgi:murein DD-endopeptidase MepM/ murein hydrolase activator NlpD